MIRLWKPASMLLATGAMAGSVFVFGQEKPTETAPRTGAKDTPVFEVKRGPLRVVVIEPGSVEAAQAQDVSSQVEGLTSIVSLVPEGQKVKKGDLVCELDSSALKDNLINQEITTKGAFAAYQQAKLMREVAEIAVKEYQEGLYPQQKATTQSDLEIAELDRSRADKDLARITKAREQLDAILAPRGENRGPSEILADIQLDDRLRSAQLNAQRAKFALEQARTKEKILEVFDHPKRMMELQSEVEKTKSDELAKEATWVLHQSKEEKLKRQILHCKLLAPCDGVVTYANDPPHRIEEGATVHQRQKIFSLPDLGGPWLVNAKVRETIIARIAPGQRVQVRVLGLPGEALTGVVESIAPRPDSVAPSTSDLKVYSTTVRLERNAPGLRPGMSAQVETVLTDLDNVLSIPLQAVLEPKDKDYVYVVTPAGFARREVTLGLFNDTRIEVKEGLLEGDKVAMNPVSLMSETELREAFAVSKDARAREASPATAKPRVQVQAKTQGLRGNFNPALFQKFRNISDEDRARLKTASPKEWVEIMKKAGFTDAEIEMLKQMRTQRAPVDGSDKPRR